MQRPPSLCCVPGAHLRLADGRHGCEGRVEVWDGRSWGTVCDDFWDLGEAQVVCRQLGCGPATAAPGSAHFGAGSGHILLDNMWCHGNEASLLLCGHNGWGVHNCVHREDAGVICEGREAAPRGAPGLLSPPALNHHCGTLCPRAPSPEHYISLVALLPPLSQLPQPPLRLQKVMLSRGSSNLFYLYMHSAILLTLIACAEYALFRS